MAFSFKKLFRIAPELKASRTAQVVALQSCGRARWTPRDYAALSREGYLKNAIVHRAVTLVAENAGSVAWLLYEGDAEHDRHPLLDLIGRPNPRQDGASFIETLVSHLQLAGNAYVEAVTIEGRVRELHALRPDRMRVVPGSDGWPEAYEYHVAGRSVRFEQAQDFPPILQLSHFHPLDDHYGMSPVEAGAVAIDTHNAAAAWNKALLDNAARPSGALVYSGPDHAILSDTQFERLKRELEDNYQGAVNAGRPLLLEGGLDWKAMSLTPKDMDFLDAKHNAAREIALCFGVPPVLLGTGRAATVMARLIGHSASGEMADAAIAAIRNASSQTLIARLCDERLAFLKSLKTWPVFGAGWGRRVADVRRDALAMARGATAPALSNLPAAGKGRVPEPKLARAGSAAASVAAGAGAAQAAHASGAPLSLILAFAAAGLALAIAAWARWNVWRKRKQETPAVLPDGVVP